MVVGLEVHVQLKTRTKIFCRCSTRFRRAAERATPVRCVSRCPARCRCSTSTPSSSRRAPRSRSAARCSRRRSSRARTTSIPICRRATRSRSSTSRSRPTGAVEIGARADGSPIRIGITRVHMEEDAGKSIHDRFPASTAVDLNRAGVPLVEIVSEPDIRSRGGGGRVPPRAQADPRVRRRQRRQHGGGKPARRRERQRAPPRRDEARHQDRGEEHELLLRRRARARGGVRAAVRAARGRRHDRAADDALGREQRQVRPARSKEGSHDYRYFPEPDLPPLILALELDRRSARTTCPSCPTRGARASPRSIKLGDYDVEVLTASPRLADYFEPVARAHGDPKTAANWVMGEVMAALKTTGEDDRTLPRAPGGSRGAARPRARRRRQSHRGEADLRAHGRDGRSAGADRRARRAASRSTTTRSSSPGSTRSSPRIPTEAERFRGGEKKLQGVLVGAGDEEVEGARRPEG